MCLYVGVRPLAGAVPRHLASLAGSVLRSASRGARDREQSGLKLRTPKTPLNLKVAVSMSTTIEQAEAHWELYKAALDNGSLSAKKVVAIRDAQTGKVLAIKILPTPGQASQEKVLQAIEEEYIPSA